jgi:hypothetical protein
VFPRPKLFFPSKTWFFGIYLNFQWQKSLKNQYLPHSEFKSYQINSIKSCSSRSFQQHQRHIPIPLNFQLRLNLISEKNHSIFKNFCIISPNVMAPSPCTPPHWELSKDTTNTIWSIPVQWISYLQNKTKPNKTNYLPSYLPVDQWTCWFTQSKGCTPTLAQVLVYA